MAFKLIESARVRWHGVNAPHLAALVCAGAVLVSGKLVKRPARTPAPGRLKFAAARR